MTTTTTTTRKKKKKPPTFLDTHVRLPLDLADLVRQLADLETRTVQGQITHILRDWFAKYHHE